MREAPLCSKKIHYRQLRIEATLGQAGHHPVSNEKISHKKLILPSWQLVRDLKLEIIFGSGVADERDRNFKAL